MIGSVYEELLNVINVENFKSLTKTQKSDILFKILSRQPHKVYYSTKLNDFNQISKHCNINNTIYMLQIDENLNNDIENKYIAVIKGNGDYLYSNDTKFFELLKFF